MKKTIIIPLIIILTFLIVLVFDFSSSKYSHDKKWVKEYVVGEEGIVGSVDVSDLGDNPAYQIGANKYGMAVFKNPEKAFEQMKVDYSKGLSAIKKEYGLFEINNENYMEYGTYGWQLTETADEETIQQAIMVTKFLDIYENSF